MSDTGQIVLRGKAVIAAVAEYAANKAEADRLDAANKVLRDTIIPAMGNAALAQAGAHIVRVTNVVATPPTPNVVITRSMIGTVILGKKGRAASTRLEVI